MEDIVDFTGRLGQIAEGIAFIASLVFYRKYNFTALRYLPFILGYIFLTEMFGEYLYYDVLGFNAIFFNISNTCFFIFFFYVFYNFLEKRNYRKLIKILSLGFLFAVLIDFYLQDIIREPFLYSYIIGGICIIICVVLYFLEMLNSSRVLHMKQDLLFWFGVGLLLFFVGYIPIKISRLFFTTADNSFKFLTIIHRFLIVILYGCFTLGLVWKKAK